MKFILSFILIALAWPYGAMAEPIHRVAIHVDDSDPKRMNLALNNAQNVIQHYRKKGQQVEIRIVAYGPGLHMLRQDTSPVKDRIAALSLEHDGLLSFAACGNTRRKMSQAAGQSIMLVDEAEMVQSGVVELIELQAQGWAYIRP